MHTFDFKFVTFITIFIICCSDLQTQNFFYAISDTGGTISPSIATEAMCLLIDANRIFDVLEDDEVDELTMEYYALTLHDAAGKEICGVNITKYSIQMREVTILDKTYPASNNLYRIRIYLLSTNN